MGCNFGFGFDLLFNHAAFLTLLICGVRALMCLVSFQFVFECRCGNFCFGFGLLFNHATFLTLLFWCTHVHVFGFLSILI